jgi:hypothetical protein
MSLMHIRAQFQCDGCGRAFLVEMDPGNKVTPDWTLFEHAEDFLRGAGYLQYVDEKRSGLRESGPYASLLTSIQSGHHLCPSCTFKVDEFVNADCDATPEQIKQALAQNTFENAVNPGSEDEENYNGNQR